MLNMWPFGKWHTDTDSFTEICAHLFQCSVIRNYGSAEDASFEHIFAVAEVGGEAIHET